MGARAAVHPTDQTLESYSLGRLDGASAASVDKHLDSCPDCQRRVAELSSDSLLERLQDDQRRPDSTDPVGSSLAGLPRPGAETSPPRPAPESLPPGLADHADYEVLRELGQGGMGTVYLALNRLMDRREVLKVVSSHLMNRRGVLDRFLGEIRNAARLHHPNIVTAYSAMRLGDSIVFAMEYVDGLDLSRLVKTNGRLPVAHACNFVHQAALGLQHAHEHGMVHRDIKPSNLMLAKQGSRAAIKVLDFGLAKVRSEGTVDVGLTHEGQMLGTPDYVAPEQTIDARKADIRADIYSLGCTLYYLLSGGPPFQANSLYEILQAHHSMDALPLNLARPDVPVELAAVVARMMAKEPDHRFQTPREVAQALSPFFKKGTTGTDPARPVGSETETARESRASTRVNPLPTELAPSMTPARSIPLQPPNTAAARSEPARWSVSDAGQAEPTPRPAHQRPQWLWPAIVAASVLGLIAMGVVVTMRTSQSRIKSVVEDPRAVASADREVEYEPKSKTAPADHWVESTPIPPEIPPPVSNPNPAPPPARQRAPLEIAKAIPKRAVPQKAAAKRAAHPVSRKADILSGKWSIHGDELAQSSQDRGAMLVFGDPSWSHYDLKFEVKFIKGKEGNWAFFHFANGANHCNMYTGGFNNTVHGVGTLVDGKIKREQVKGSIRYLQWYKVRIEVRGAAARCFLNDKGPLPHFDDRRTRGRVGLGSFHTVVHFRNIEVTTPDGRVLWHGLPELPDGDGGTAVKGVGR